MAIVYYGSQISPHIDRTPEGYLICRNVPINRTGTQVYGAGELKLPGDPNRPVNVYRLKDDVFAPAALASFEGKDITRGHPPEMLNAENQAGYSKGHLENVRRDGENTVADLIIKDPGLVSDVENGILREVSCGYNCTFEPYMDGYKQTHIIGNHLAIVPRGRAGRDVAIHDAASKAEKGRNKLMRDFCKSILTAFGMAAKDASPEELDKMVETTAGALDAEPAEKALEAEPAKEGNVDTADVMVERAPKGDDLGSKLDELISMVKELRSKNEREERRLSDEVDIDKMIAKLAGEEEEDKEGKKAIVIPTEETDACLSSAKDAAIKVLRKVRPVVASIEDRTVRAKVTDALLSAVQGKNIMNDIAKATLDSAQFNANQTQKTSYDQMCAESEANYAALNPHRRKEN